MSKCLQHLSACCALLGALWSPGLALAAPASLDEVARGALASSPAWPGDIVRWADQVLSQDPDASGMQTLRQRALMVMAVLRSPDVQLYRTAFQTELGSSERNADLRLAALGDPDAAYRMAAFYRGAADPREARRQIGWLQLAAKLGHDEAAYELALLFRRQGQLVQAASYEARAVALGFQPPASLDHVRK